MILLSFTPLQNTYASAVPVVQEVSTKSKISTIKKVQKKKNKIQTSHQHFNKKKKHPETMVRKGFGWGWIFLVWYAAFVAMLIVGIVFGILAVWAVALVFLCLPLLAVLVLLIVFIVAIRRDGFSLC